MTSPHRRMASVAITAFCVVPAAGALAAQASAATLKADRACYVNANPAQGAAMVITGSGLRTRHHGAADRRDDVRQRGGRHRRKRIDPGPGTRAAHDRPGIEGDSAHRHR